MKNMQASQFNCLLAVVLAGTWAVSAASALAADSGNIIIQGTVAPVNELTVTPQAGYDSLELGTGETDVTVAVVNEKNNDPDGYTVTLVSGNAQAAASSQPRLKGADGANAAEINYSIKYGAPAAEVEVTLDATGSAVVTSTTEATPELGSDKNLKISFAGSTWRNADTYSDTLTLTIAAK